MDSRRSLSLSSSCLETSFVLTSRAAVLLRRAAPSAVASWSCPRRSLISISASYFNTSVSSSHSLLSLAISALCSLRDLPNRKVVGVMAVSSKAGGGRYWKEVGVTTFDRRPARLFPFGPHPRPPSRAPMEKRDSMLPVVPLSTNSSVLLRGSARRMAPPSSGASAMLVSRCCDLPTTRLVGLQRQSKVRCELFENGMKAPIPNTGF